jgi:hypothetical protein
MIDLSDIPPKMTADCNLPAASLSLSDNKTSRGGRPRRAGGDLL